MDFIILLQATACRCRRQLIVSQLGDRVANCAYFLQAMGKGGCSMQTFSGCIECSKLVRQGTSMRILAFFYVFRIISLEIPVDLARPWTGHQGTQP